MKTAVTVFLLLTLVAVAGVADEHKSAIAPNPQFDKMKTLEGSWVGSMSDAGKAYPASTRFQIVSDGSALMAWLGEGSPFEMVTIFHMDGTELMGTHYCAAHNQPRFVAVAGGDPNRIVFKFKDGTNIGAHDGHMEGVTFIFEAPDRHVEEWTYVDKDGKVSTSRFEFKRKS